MAKIPDQRTTKNLIEMHDITNNDPRPYLGMSSIGGDCERKLWYGFHFVNPEQSHSQRTGRIFSTGHRAEAFMIADLKRIGCEVYRWVDGKKVELMGTEKTSEQDTCTDIAGHFSGHTDGEVLNVPEAPKTSHLLEMKTHNDKSFKDVVKNGVKKSKPTHWGQVQTYMHYRKLTRTLYIAYNKNDSDYYIERIVYDKDEALDYIRKASAIIMSEVPPACKFPKTWFSCKWCDYRDICHEGDAPAANCRTCDESDICNDGKWECGLDGKELSKEAQLAGCEMYKIGWGLL